jgi:hypothetical protein
LYSLGALIIVGALASCAFTGPGVLACLSGAGSTVSSLLSSLPWATIGGAAAVGGGIQGTIKGGMAGIQAYKEGKSKTEILKNIILQGGKGFLTGATTSAVATAVGSGASDAGLGVVETAIAAGSAGGLTNAIINSESKTLSGKLLDAGVGGVTGALTGGLGNYFGGGQVTGVAQGAIQGAQTGAIVDGTVGLITNTVTELKAKYQGLSDKEYLQMASEIVKNSLKSAGLGAILGGTIGGAAGFVNTMAAPEQKESGWLGEKWDNASGWTKQILGDSLSNNATVQQLTNAINNIRGVPPPPTGIEWFKQTLLDLSTQVRKNPTAVLNSIIRQAKDRAVNPETILRRYVDQYGINTMFEQSGLNQLSRNNLYTSGFNPYANPSMPRNNYIEKRKPKQILDDQLRRAGISQEDFGDSLKQIGRIIGRKPAVLLGHILDEGVNRNHEYLDVYYDLLQTKPKSHNRKNRERYFMTN